jgi:predicted nucleotidyltransferase
METTLPKDFKEFLKLLNEHNVKYLLIGGYAVGYHGYPRATNDMVFWVEHSVDNATKLLAVAKEFGFDLPEVNHSCPRSSLEKWPLEG